MKIWIAVMDDVTVFREGNVSDNELLGLMGKRGRQGCCENGPFHFTKKLRLPARKYVPYVQHKVILGSRQIASHVPSLL
jgi:hypothetical protein